jgi:DNA-binding NarL/FixJ family response regulator
MMVSGVLASVSLDRPRPSRLFLMRFNSNGERRARRHLTFRSRQITALYEKITEATGEIEKLSLRETEILQALADGKSNKEIAVETRVTDGKLSP